MINVGLDLLFKATVLREFGYSRKNSNRGVKDMEFPGVIRKVHVENLEVNLKRRGISRSVQEKLMWNFNESWLLTLEFPRAVRQTTQNDVSIRFSMGSVEERINMSIDVSENTMESFFKNVKHVIVF